MEQNNEEFSAAQLAALLEAAGLTAAFKNGSLAPGDEERLEAWLAQDDLHRQWFEHWRRHPELPEMQNAYARWEEETPAAYASFRDKYISPATPVHRVSFFRRWGWAAAAVILIIGAVLAITVSTNHRSLPSAHLTSPAEISPGKNGAILTLADGSQVSLDTFKNATVALQGGVTAKVVNGALVYEGKGDAVGYNTMSTPKGRQFRLTLPDGTQVWLNAASSIRYPTTFTGHQRQVEITGEAYFEVAKNEQLPFLVNVNKQMDIRVLGTHFNIAAYENEPGIYATLLEGRIQLLRANASVVLKPGQQARLLHNDASGKLQVVENVNQVNVTAWKDGYFNFQGLSYEEIMRQLERWYDIQVVIGKNVRQRSIGGEMTKDVSLDGVLDYLTDLGIHYRLEGRILTILP